MYLNMKVLAITVVVASLGFANAALVVTNANREIKLVSQSTNVQQKLTVRNDGKTAEQTVDFCFLTPFLGSLSVLEAMYDKDPDAQLFQIAVSEHGGEGSSCLAAVLGQPLAPGKSVDVQLVATFTQLQKPFPASIFQNEPQRMLYLDTVHILSPYKVLKQKTKVHLPSKKVESYTKAEPVAQKSKELIYGPYTDVRPLTKVELRLHYENNSPFAVATHLKREIEVSHWGNVYVEEHYIIKHTGAKLRGEFSRLDLMKNAQVFGQAAIRGFMATLPKSAHSVYFRDPIGNISTTNIGHSLQTLDVVLSPRFPLYGGWSTEFTLGYSLPLGDAVRKNKDGTLNFAMMFGSPIAGLVVEDIQIRVVLPEGSVYKGASTAFEVNKGYDRKYTYLDTLGRPVLTLQRNNIGVEHNVAFIVSYTFSPLSLLQEPLLLVAVFALAFAVVIAYNRCNFRITKDKKWAAEIRAEQATHLLQEIGSIVAERKRALDAVTSSSDVLALQRKLAQSAERLQQKCKALERLGGPGLLNKVEKYLEEERGIQARIDKICNSTSKSSGKEATSAQIASELKQISSDVQQQYGKQIETLQ